MPGKTTKVTTKATAKVKEKAAKKTAAGRAKAKTRTAGKTSRKKTAKPVRAKFIGTSAPSGFNREDIERLAYSLFENRGGKHGSDLDDWLEAEKIVIPHQ